MDWQRDEIVAIPPNRVRYFGGTGRMLLPCPATVAAVIERVPEHRLITTDRLRQELTEQFDVQGTCPVTTQRALQVVAREFPRPIAYWRVITQNGGLISRFPGGVDAQAALLRDEGFTIHSANGSPPKVAGFKDSLVRLG